jgi:Ca2+-binding RTX toxin-like protein
MSINTYLTRLRRWAKPAAKPGKARQARPRLGLENLEDRLALSQITYSGPSNNRLLTYQASHDEANDLQISFVTNANGTTTYTFEEKSGVAIVDQLGNSHSKVTADSTLFKSIQVNLTDPNNPDTKTKNDSVKVFSTNVPINIAGGDGNDTVTVGDDRAGGQGMELVTQSVSFDGGSQKSNGKDLLIVADRNAPVLTASTLSYDFFGASVTRFRLTSGTIQSSVNVTGSHVEEIDVNASNQSDAMAVHSILKGTPVVINAGNGDDKVTSDNMDNLADSLTVKGEGGTDSLTILDGSVTDRNYVITTTKVSQGTATINLLDTLEGGLTLDASTASGKNTFDVQSSTSLMPLTLNGGTGRDTVTISDQARTALDTYDFYEGRLERWTFVLLTLPSAYINYSKVDNLVVNAGSGSNSFMMTDTAQPDLTINGGGGIDTIDYSAFTKNNVYVNLFTGKTNNKVSKLSGVENAIGGAGNDILVGDANANLLVGNAGNDVIIGGQGADTIRGEAGEDLEIAGYTDFDGDQTQLDTIRSTWAGSGNTQSRINSLRNGVSGVKLSDDSKTGTIHDDGAHDVLTGGSSTDTSTADWFWANKGTKANQDSLTDYVKNTDILN